MIDFDLDLARWLVISVVVSLGIFGLRTWLPKAAGRRVAERGTIVGPASKPTFEEQAMKRTGADLQAMANRQLHDEMVTEAVKLKVRARTGTDEDRLRTLARAVEKVKDALTARPESYDGTKLLAELFLDRAMLANDEASVADLQQAAVLFEKASSFRLGIIDNYVGGGWAYLQMTRVDPEFAAVYAEKAARSLAAGFARVQQNVWVLRGWGIAIDRMARDVAHDPAKLTDLEGDYRAALGQHRGGQHDLFEWYSEIRRAHEPAWVAVPPLRDVY